MDFSSCLQKQEDLKNQFITLNSSDQRYEKVIGLGRSLPPYPEKEKCEDNLVLGCQSILYLKIDVIEGKLKLQLGSDALISAGLAAMLVSVYQDEPPEAILKCPPTFIKEIGLLETLSSNRSNGLKSLYKKMQLESLKLIAS